MLFEGISPFEEMLGTTEDTDPKQIPLETKQVREGMEMQKKKGAKSSCKVTKRASKTKSKHAMAKPYEEKPYACTFCEKEFANKQYLNRHAKRMHPEHC